MDQASRNAIYSTTKTPIEVQRFYRDAKKFPGWKFLENSATGKGGSVLAVNKKVKVRMLSGNLLPHPSEGGKFLFNYSIVSR
ncbi:hypothetical protein [Streptomyces sp. NPDC086835]|uniref:hypothetical protein n=1 Tax=Streptomyces sp. NPDC086835 TaxID=3365761 RepID=UPI00380B3E11